MANIGTLMVTIDGETFKLQRELKKAEAQMKRFTSRSVSGFNRIRSAARAVKGQIAALVGIGGTLLIGLGIRKTVTEFVRFEDALLDLQKVMSDTEGSAKSFIGVTEELSNKFGESAAEVLQGAANFKQAGFTVQEAFKLQEVALRAATVSNLNVIDSSKIVIRILKGFKAPASEAARVLDILNEVSNKFATNLGELATGMAQLSPVARLMGFSFEETAAILTPIIEVFGSGSEAAVALRTSLLRLVSDQQRVQETLRGLGVRQKEVNGLLRSGKDILFDVAKAFQGLAQNQKVHTAAQLVGIRQAARAVEVFDGLAKVQEIHKVALNSVNSAMKEQEIRLGSVGKKLDRLREVFNNTARTIGGTVAPALVEVITLFGKLASLAIAPFRFNLTELADDVKGFLKIARTTSEEIAAIRAGGIQTIPSAKLRGIQPLRGSIPDFLKRNKEAKLSMADLFVAQDNLAIQVDKTMERFNLEAQGINRVNKSLAETIIFMRELNQTTLVPQTRELIDTGFLNFRKQPFIEQQLISETQLFEMENSAKRVQKAFRDMGLNTDIELRKVARSLIENFKIIELEGKESAKRLSEIWALTAKQIEPSALGKEMGEVFVRLSVQFDNTKDKIKEVDILFKNATNNMRNNNSIAFEAMKNATQGWASNFSRTLTDIMFGAEFTFSNILESFARMITEMFIQLAFIQPLMQAVFGAFGLGATTLAHFPTVTAASGVAIANANPNIVGMKSPTDIIPSLEHGGIVPGAFGKPVPIIAHGGEEFLGAGQSRRGRGGGSGSNIEINIIGAPSEPTIEEGESGNGGRRIDVIFDDKMSEQVRTGSRFSNKMMSQFRGMSTSRIAR